MQEGNLLGHIVSPKGIRIDLARVESIQKINALSKKKEIQSFLGNINFMRRFIPNLAKKFKHTTCSKNMVTSNGLLMQGNFLPPPNLL